MAKANMMTLKEPEDFTRSDLNQWRSNVRNAALKLIRAEYADSPYRWLADLDEKWIDAALADSIADATHDAWLKLEER
jgi:hypothetical protein